MQQFRLGARASVPGLAGGQIEASRYRDGLPQHRIAGGWYDEDAIRLVGDDMPETGDSLDMDLDVEYSLLVEELLIDKSKNPASWLRLAEMLGSSPDAMSDLTLDDETWCEIPSTLRNGLIASLALSTLGAMIRGIGGAK